MEGGQWQVPALTEPVEDAGRRAGGRRQIQPLPPSHCHARAQLWERRGVYHSGHCKGGTQGGQARAGGMQGGRLGRGK